MQFLWQSSTKHGVTLKVSNPWIQLLNRENDAFIMDKIIATPHPTHILERLNDVRLWLQVSRLSDIVNQTGDKIENWALHGPPKKSNVQWPKRKRPVGSNLKMWRDVVRRLFCGEKGLHPKNLGKVMHPLSPNDGARNGNSFGEVINQYPTKYKKLLGEATLGEAQVILVIKLLQDNQLYAGSDGSVKHGIGSHAYGFTCGKRSEIVWGGASITPGDKEEMSSLRAEHSGAVGVLLILYAIQIYMKIVIVPKYSVNIWIDNAEVLARGERGRKEQT
jgi:hypothetical protein